MEDLSETLDAVERQLERAHERIEREGSTADAALLLAVSGLLDVVRKLEQRNDPLAAEKLEARWWAQMREHDEEATR